MSSQHQAGERSVSASAAAEKFLNEAQQFRLGSLITETPHPVSKDLSATAREDIAAGLKTLFAVDADVVEKFREWSQSGQAERIRDSLVDSLTAGAKVFFTGCGSTGRLSIQMVSIWRAFWQKMREEDLQISPAPQEWEDRAFSAMAGGDFALIKAVEGFEDFTQFGRKQIADLGVSEGDVVLAITEGGETSFVIGTAWEGLDRGAKVYFVYNNPDGVLCERVIRSREIIQEPRIEKVNLTTGPMAITGSTRMQATSIQLAVLLTIFEMVIRDLLRRMGVEKWGSSEGVPQDVLAALGQTHKTLMSNELHRELASIVEAEETVYRSGHKNSYFADALAIDVLTDTTERSPTFCIPAFRKWDDTEAAESWSFLFMPYESSELAWERLLRRRPQPVEWSLEDVEALLGKQGLASRQHEVMKDIGMSEIHRFKIGMDGLAYRPFVPGDSATAVLTASEMDQLTDADGFYGRQLGRAREQGAQTGIIFLGDQTSAQRARAFIEGWDPQARTVFLETPESSFILGPAARVGVKMLLNALSTCIMVRLGRVMGNVMIWVVPSNLKLIDRSTRYISQLAQVSYEDACRMLFDVIEYVTPRMKAGKAYPAPVGVSVMRLTHKVGNDEAERMLYEETGLNRQ